jgi:hypothetical protein
MFFNASIPQAASTPDFFYFFLFLRRLSCSSMLRSHRLQARQTTQTQTQDTDTDTDTDTDKDIDHVRYICFGPLHPPYNPKP